MKSRSIICLLAALSAMAGILMTTSCSLEGSDYYINGTIGGNTHNKSGYVSAEAVFGETLLLAADSQAEFYAGNNCWITGLWFFFQFLLRRGTCPTPMPLPPAQAATS